MVVSPLYSSHNHVDDITSTGITVNIEGKPRLVAQQEHATTCSVHFTLIVWIQATLPILQPGSMLCCVICCQLGVVWVLCQDISQLAACHCMCRRKCAFLPFISQWGRLGLCLPCKVFPTGQWWPVSVTSISFFVHDSSIMCI